MWSAYFNALSLMVLPNYQKQMDHYEKYLAKQPHPKQRFNDFLARQALMVDLVRKYWNITKPTEEILDRWIEQWSNEAEKSDTEIDQAVQRLQIVFTNPKYMIADTKADDLKVCDYCAQLEHGVTSNELHTIFCAAEKEFGLPRAYGSAAVLATVADLRAALSLGH